MARTKASIAQAARRALFMQVILIMNTVESTELAIRYYAARLIQSHARRMNRTAVEAQLLT